MSNEIKKCNNCGATIPADSEFCQYCGATLPHNERILEQPSSVEDNLIFSAIKDDQSLTRETRFSLDKGQEQSKKKTKLLTTILIVIAAVAVILAGLNIYQLLANSKNNQAISDYETQIKKKDDEIKKKNDEINSVKSQLSEANKKASSYDTLISALKNNYGYATYYFCVNQGIVVLNTGGSKTLTLTAAFGTYASISSSTDSMNVANVIFNESSWEGDYTTITVKAGNTKGIAKISFSNSVDSSSFKVLVIVI